MYSMYYLNTDQSMAIAYFLKNLTVRPSTNMYGISLALKTELIVRNNIGRTYPIKLIRPQGHRATIKNPTKKNRKDKDPHHLPPSSSNIKMVAFDKCETRPAHIEAILNGLDRYNPETTTVFQDYVSQQCEDRTFDCYANLALLKL